MATHSPGAANLAALALTRNGEASVIKPGEQIRMPVRIILEEYGYTLVYKIKSIGAIVVLLSQQRDHRNNKQTDKQTNKHIYENALYRYPPPGTRVTRVLRNGDKRHK